MTRPHASSLPSTTKRKREREVEEKKKEIKNEKNLDREREELGGHDSKRENRKLGERENRKLKVKKKNTTSDSASVGVKSASNLRAKPKMASVEFINGLK